MRRAPGVVAGRKGHRDAVIDVGVDQPLFELGDLDRVVDVSRLPRREAAHEIGLGPRSAAERDGAHPHNVVGGEPERRLDGLVVVVDDHFARQGFGVGVAGLVQRRQRPGLRRQNVRRPAGGAGDQLQWRPWRRR